MQKKQNYRKRIFPCKGILSCAMSSILLLWNCSCIFRSQDSAEQVLSRELDYTSLYAERISRIREKKIFEEKYLIFCADADFPSSAMGSLRKELEKEQIRLKRLPAAESPMLLNFLRNGKADLIAGRFSPDLLRNRKLFPFPVSPAEKETVPYCFVIRMGNERLKELLGRIPFTPQGNRKKEWQSHENRKK